MSELNRRDFLSLLGSAAAGTAAMSFLGIRPQSAAAASGTSSKPNFVVILADDMGYSDLGCYGNKVIRTPNFDSLATDGMRFTDFYSGSAVCSPSRACLLTGRNHNRLGIFDWISANSGVYLPRKEVAIPKLLHGQGYATCHVGKWHLNSRMGAAPDAQPSDHGYDHWLATQNNAEPNKENPTNFYRNGTAIGAQNKWAPTIIVDEAISWLNSQQNSDKPFMLSVWFHNPHLVIGAAPSFVDKYAKQPGLPGDPKWAAKYYGDITQMDYEVGRLLKRLDELGKRDNTVVLATSDNGPQKSYPGRAVPLREYKVSVYEGGLRVPGVVRWPGKVKPGSICNDAASFYDVLPTFAAIAGATVPTDRVIDGQNIQPLLEGGKISRSKPLFWRYKNGTNNRQFAMRDGDWKLVTDGSFANPELFNIREDISEKTNLASQESARLAQMIAQAKSRWTEISTEWANYGGYA